MPWGDPIDNSTTPKSASPMKGGWGAPIPFPKEQQQGLSPSPTGLIERGYETLAKPVTGALEKGQEFVGIPEWAAKPIAQTIVPQTATGAALTAAGFMMPELGAGKILGEAAGPVERFLGSHAGRLATMAGIGAGAEKLSGGSALTGAEQGAGGELLGQGLHGAASMVAHRAGLPAMLRDTTSKFGQALTKEMPWLGKVENTQDFADRFIHGGAHERALTMLHQTKTGIAQAAKGETFSIPMAENGWRPLPMTFEEADRALTDMQHHAYLPVGDPRTGTQAPDFSRVAAEARKIIVDKLNKIRPKLGDDYSNARSRLDAAFVLGGSPKFKRGGIFRDPRVFDRAHGAVSEPVMIERINKYSPDLQRSIGKKGVDNLLDTLRRGAKGEVADVPAGGRPNLRLGVNPVTGVPRPFMTLGQSYKAVGKTPKYFQPPHAPVEAATQNMISEMRAAQPEEHSPGPGVKALDKSRAEAIAPTPSASKHAEKTAEKLTKGKQPDVHKALNQGRLSMDETNKLVKHASATDPSSLVADVPLSEMLDALEKADPHERQVLIPLVIQRLKQELPQQQNKTLASNLSQRFQRIQQMPSQQEAKA